MNTHSAPGMRQAASVTGIACLFAVQFAYFPEGRGLNSLLLYPSQATGAFLGGLLCGALLFSLHVMRSWAGVLSAGTLTMAGALLWATSEGVADARTLVACMAGGMLFPLLLNRLFDTFSCPGLPLGLAFGLGDFFWLFLFVLPTPLSMENMQLTLACLHAIGGLMAVLSLWQQRVESSTLEEHTSAVSSPLRTEHLPPSPLLKESLIYLVLAAMVFFSLNALTDIAFYRVHETAFLIPGYIHLYLWIIYPLTGLYIDRVGPDAKIMLLCIGCNTLSLISAFSAKGNLVYLAFYCIGIVCRDIVIIYLLIAFSRFRRSTSYPCIITSLTYIIMFTSFMVTYIWIQNVPERIFKIILLCDIVAVLFYILVKSNFEAKIPWIIKPLRIAIDDHQKEEKCQKNFNLIQFSKKYGITSREQDVLLLITKGYDTNKISETLYLSENTVKSHVSKLLRKTETRNRITLTALFFNEARMTSDVEKTLIDGHRELPAL